MIWVSMLYWKKGIWALGFLIWYIDPKTNYSPLPLECKITAKNGAVEFSSVWFIFQINF
jgi:hypothetical protein